MDRDREFLVIVIGLMIMIGSIIVIMTWIHGPLMQFERYRAQLYQKCNEMNLGDNSTEGLVMKLQEQCFKL